MKIGMQVQGLKGVQATYERLSGGQKKVALAGGINDAAFAYRRALQQEIGSVFDRPTPYVRNSVYVKQATVDRLEATIVPTYFGGKGVDPQKILAAQELGGRRVDKRSEAALRRVGILPRGYQTAIPDDARGGPFPGSDDGRGNLRGAFLSQLISYFQAFGEQGYRANMTDKRKASLRRGTAKQQGRRYFVSYGRTRGDAKTSHLGMGIWAVVGDIGADVRAVLMFVRAPTYKPRLSTESAARRVDLDNYLAKRLRYRIRQVAGR